MSLLDQIKGMVDQALGYKEDAKNLWQELEEDEEMNKSFYRKFTINTTPSTTVMETIKEKMALVQVHFNQLLEDPGQKSSSQGRNIKVDLSKVPDYPISMVVKVVQNIQELVRDHGVALEFIRELFNQQDQKLSEVEAKVLAPGEEVTEMVEFTVAQKVEAKTKDISAKVEAMEGKLDELQAENKQLKKENKQLAAECDETRQRTMKGNLKISCPPRAGQERRDTPARVGGRMETLTEVNVRLIREETGAIIPVEDVAACHVLPENDFSYILRIGNMAPDSGWAALAAGMVCGKRCDTGKYFENSGVFINFQLTEARSNLRNQLRLARKKKLIHKFSVNQNGRLTFLKERSPRATPGQAQAKEPWVVVRDMASLTSLFPEVSFPLATTPAAPRTPGAGAAAAARREGNH